MEIQPEMRKVDAKNTLPKTRFDLKASAFKKITSLVLTTQNKTLC